MSFFSYVFRNGLWISVLLFVGSAGLLAYCILNVIRVVKDAHLLSVPLLEQQEIEFTEAGPVVLCIQGPQLSTRFAHLSYELLTDSVPIEGRTTLMHSKTSGFSWVRMEMKSYTLPRPGRYTLRIKGLEPGATADAKHSIVFMRPHLGQSMKYVLGIVLAGMLLIGSIVFFFLRLAFKDGGA
jgi:hypothetical protein